MYRNTSRIRRENDTNIQDQAQQEFLHRAEEGIDQLRVDRDARKGNTDIHREAPPGTMETLEPPKL